MAGQGETFAMAARKAGSAGSSAAGTGYVPSSGNALWTTEVQDRSAVSGLSVPANVVTAGASIALSVIPAALQPLRAFVPAFNAGAAPPAPVPKAEIAQIFRGVAAGQIQANAKPVQNFNPVEAGLRVKAALDFAKAASPANAAAPQAAPGGRMAAPGVSASLSAFTVAAASIDWLGHGFEGRNAPIYQTAPDPASSLAAVYDAPKSTAGLFGASALVGVALRDGVNGKIQFAPDQLMNLRDLTAKVAGSYDRLNKKGVLVPVGDAAGLAAVTPAQITPAPKGFLYNPAFA